MAIDDTNACRHAPSDESAPRKVRICINNYPPDSDVVLRTGLSTLYKHSNRPNQVCKVPNAWEEPELAHKIERSIYQRLGEHSNLVKVVEMDQYGIWLEWAAHGCLRQYYVNGGEATLDERVNWCRDVANVLGWVHEKNVRHADLSGRNLLIDSKMKILLCDFSGSSIDGERATIKAEAGYRHPNKDEYSLPTIRCEIHTLGSTIYEIITGKEPHQGIDKESIARLIAEGNYPPLDVIPLRDVIRGCWKGSFLSAVEVAKAIIRYSSISSFA